MTKRTVSHAPTLSIGALSQATGIPVETLRTWERRYEYPNPERSAGGHRLYRPEDVERLKLVSRALEQGHRPRQILTSSPTQLEALLGLESAIEPEGVDHDEPRSLDALASWIEAVQNLDERRLDALLRTTWSQLGGMRFVVERLAPFMIAIGERWERGEFTVLHEHFASERVRDFVGVRWREVSDRAAGKPLFCTTLPGEQHSIGLHMAATVLALGGARIQYFGVNTPIDDIVEAAARLRPAGLIVSVSQSASAAETRAALARISAQLPAETSVIIGGAGAPSEIDGVVVIDDFPALRRWYVARNEK